MKRIMITVLALFLGTSAVWAQNKNVKPAKAKPAPADCSATTDAQITDNVKAKLGGTASLKDQTINVATSAGVVTLTGSVKKGIQKGLATRQAQRVPCVKKVENQITVEKSSTAATRNTNSRKKTANKNI